MRKFLTLIIIFIAFAFLFRVDLVFYILYVCVGIYVWNYWSIPYRTRKLTLEREVTSHAFWNETIDVQLRLKNNGILPFAWIELYESLAIELHPDDEVNLVTSLRGGQMAEFNYRVQTSRRGYYRLGPTRMTTGDVFGFVPEQQAFYPASYLTVYPKITPLTQLGLPSRLPFGTVASRQRLFEDPARPRGIRDFRSGDSIRQINWKMTAHTRSLVVNTLQPAISLETMIVLDLESDSYQRPATYYDVEWAIEIAASFAAHLISRRQGVGLLVDGIDPLQGLGDDLKFDEYNGRLILPPEHERERPYPIKPATGRAHLMKVLEQLARAERAKREPFHEWLSHTLVPISWGGTVVIITPKADEALCGVLFQMVRKGLNPLLVQIRKTADFSQIRQRAKSLGFVAIEVIDDKDMHVKQM